MTSHSIPPSPRRGAVLPITVLLCVFAATMALLLMRQSLVSLSVHHRDQRTEQATSQVAQLRAATESTLSIHPYRYLSEVLSGEPDRVCLSNPQHPSVAAGLSWRCGAKWDYVSSVPSDAAWMHLSPPTAEDPALHITYYPAGSTGSDQGLQVSYLLGSAGVFTAVSTTGNLNLSTFGDVPQIHGGLYAGGNLSIPAGMSLPGDVTAAAAGQVSGPHGDARVYDSSTSPKASAVLDVSSEATAAMIDAAHTMSCPSLLPIPDPVEMGDSQTDRVCLSPGGKVMLADGSLATLPADVHSVLLTSPAEGSGVEVRYMTSIPDVVIGGTGSPRDAVSEAAFRVTAGTHGGQLSAWAVLGVIRLPESGVVASEVPVWLGLCDAADVSHGFMDPVNGTCRTSVLPDGMTVVAGTSTSAKDVWLSGPVSGRRLAVLASGNVVIPWFSSTTATVAAFTATTNRVAVSTGGQFVAFPGQELSAPPLVRWSGMVSAPHVQFDWTGFSASSGWDLPVSMFDNPPSWFPPPGGGWVPVSSRWQ